MARNSATDVAKDQAGRVAATAKHATGSDHRRVTEQAGAITAEAGRQAKQLLGQARNEFTGQAAHQQQRVAAGFIRWPMNSTAWCEVRCRTASLPIWPGCGAARLRTSRTGWTAAIPAA